MNPEQAQIRSYDFDGNRVEYFRPTFILVNNRIMSITDIVRAEFYADPTKDCCGISVTFRWDSYSSYLISGDMSKKEEIEKEWKKLTSFLCGPTLDGPKP